MTNKRFQSPFTRRTHVNQISGISRKLAAMLINRDFTSIGDLCSRDPRMLHEILEQHATPAEKATILGLIEATMRNLPSAPDAPPPASGNDGTPIASATQNAVPGASDANTTAA